MALSLQARALHFVFKIGNRKETMYFYRKVLGMQTLRHEEFSEGCEAACNGPYANRWSKTMIGYGPEDTHFAIELTYNYGVKSYELGNDFLGITIKSCEVIERGNKMNWPMEEKDGIFILKAPGGYVYNIINEPQTSQDPIQKVTLASSDLQRTINYWNGILGMSIIHQTGNSVSLAFDNNTCLLEFKDIGKPVDHAKAYGRIAFAVPKESLPVIQKIIEETNQKILTNLIKLDTPGKASVTVIILADPDGHEICFVDEEGFKELSKVDPKSDEELERFMNKDKS